MHYKNSTEAAVLAALRFMATTLGIVPQHRKLNGFAEACFNDNSVDELIEALRMEIADDTDCENWNIDAVQWRAAITEALEQRIVLGDHRVGISDSFSLFNLL